MLNQLPWWPGDIEGVAHPAYFGGRQDRPENKISKGRIPSCLDGLDKLVHGNTESLPQKKVQILACFGMLNLIVERLVEMRKGI
jgi:hypothetical protein